MESIKAIICAVDVARCQLIMTSLTKQVSIPHILSGVVLEDGLAGGSTSLGLPELIAFIRGRIETDHSCVAGCRGYILWWYTPQHWCVGLARQLRTMVNSHDKNYARTTGEFGVTIGTGLYIDGVTAAHLFAFCKTYREWLGLGAMIFYLWPHGDSCYK